MSMGIVQRIETTFLMHILEYIYIYIHTHMVQRIDMPMYSEVMLAI
jgi:hypothetical protein